MNDGLVRSVALVQARALKLFVALLNDDRQAREVVLAFQSKSDEPVQLASVPCESDEELLVFSLLSLYQMLELEHELPFTVFRRVIYQGNLNEALAAKGGRICVYESVGSITENSYALVTL